MPTLYYVTTLAALKAARINLYFLLEVALLHDHR